MEIQYLSDEFIIDLHDRIVNELGGALGFLNEDLFYSATSSIMYYEDVESAAGALMYSLNKNHSFRDGNKRIACSAMLSMLALNNKSLNASDDELEKLSIGIAENTVSKDDVINFIKSYIIY